MKILVSGGAGFIGSHLVSDLLTQGHEVMVVDLEGPPDGMPPGSSGRGALHWVSHDVASPPPPMLARFKPQRIYNLACRGNPRQRLADPVQATITTVVGTRHLLHLAVECDARFLQGSSGSVYGEPAVHPQPESYFGNVNAGGAHAAHEEAHRCAETLCMSYAARSGADVRIARIFSTYGPGMDAGSGRVISNFVTQALRSEDLTIYGDGSQLRSFCHIDDMVQGLQQLMEAGGETVMNLGSAEEYTLLQLAERVLRVTGSQSRLRHCAARVDDAHRRRPDITAAERQLGWRPHIPLQQGLQSTVEFFRRPARRPATSALHS